VFDAATGRTTRQKYTTPHRCSQTVLALSRRLSTLSVLHSRSSVYGAFVWACGALNSPLRRFSARAVISAAAPAQASPPRGSRGPVGHDFRGSSASDLVNAGQPEESDYAGQGRVAWGSPAMQPGARTQWDSIGSGSLVPGCKQCAKPSLKAKVRGPSTMRFEFSTAFSRKTWALSIQTSQKYSVIYRVCVQPAMF
jgi:hypothetical protein